MQTMASSKSIANVIFALKVKQNLLRVGQLVDEMYALLFKDKSYTIFDVDNAELLIVGMKNKCFPLN